MKTFIFLISAAYVTFSLWVTISFFSFLTHDDSQYFKIDPAFEHNKKITKDIKQI